MVSRLIWLLVSALACLWLLGSVAAAILTRFEVNERLDNALQEVAQRLMPITDDSAAEPTTLRDRAERMVPALDPRALAYQILDAAGQVVVRSPNAPEVPFTGAPHSGFQDSTHYRIYTAPSPNGAYWLEVAEPEVHRSEAIGRAIELAVFPLVGFLPLSWMVIRWVVRRSLRSLIELQQEIGKRDGTNLARIPDLTLPAELLPIHAAVNRLLDRLQRALANERQFAANSAHELRTPIAAALAQMQVLSTQLHDAAQTERAGLIIRQIKGIGELTEKLLQLSRAGAGLALNREPVDLMPVLRVLVDEFRRQDGVGDRLQLYSHGTSEFIVRSDIDVVGIAIRNLLENAVRYGAVNDVIRVVATADHSIQVASGGPPVRPDLMGVLTQPFQRGTTVGQGRGLGLAIVNSIMQQVGGSLRLSSPAKGRSEGFEAVLLFPRPEGSRTARAAETSERTPRPLAAERFAAFGSPELVAQGSSGVR
ncbi:MAG: ATP-binding protein [Acetobacteraceae bacterium]|nr:ATP-binding protein [Acetobacteraceae bacterium]